MKTWWGRSPVFVAVLGLVAILPADPVGGAEVVDGIAYISNGDYVDSYLVVVDVTEPSAPIILGMAHFPNYLYDLLIEDGVAYGASCYCGLSMFDLSEPTDPRFLSNMPVESGASSYAVTSLGDHIVLGAGGLYYALPQCTDPMTVEDGFPDPDQILPAPHLARVRPSPFCSQMSIDFTLTCPQRVRAVVYDLMGSRVAVFADRHFDSGHHCLIWDGKDSSGGDAASAVYLVRLGGRRDPVGEPGRAPQIGRASPSCVEVGQAVSCPQGCV